MCVCVEDEFARDHVAPPYVCTNAQRCVALVTSRVRRPMPPPLPLPLVRPSVRVVDGHVPAAPFVFGRAVVRACTAFANLDVESSADTPANSKIARIVFPVPTNMCLWVCIVCWCVRVRNFARVESIVIMFS